MTSSTRIAVVQESMPRTGGFVLPYVLLVITILAIIGTIAADRLMETSRLIKSLDSFTEAELAFSSAESQATYSLLTGKPREGGFELADIELSPTDIFLDLETEGAPQDLWSAAGETRIAQTRFGSVYVELRDVSGLMPLNRAGADELVPFLMMLGVSKTKAARLSAGNRSLGESGPF